MNTVFQAPARKFGFAVLLVFCFALSACTEIQLASHLYKQASPPNQGSFKVGNPYKISGRTYYPEERYDLVETGIASWYGPQFHGKLTANGETFDMDELTAAHKTLQMPSIVRVTNLENHTRKTASLICLAVQPNCWDSKIKGQPKSVSRFLIPKAVRWRPWQNPAAAHGESSLL